MFSEVSQNRKQGLRIETLVKSAGLDNVVIGKKLGTSPRNVNLIIWGERKNAVIQDGIATILGYCSWRALSTFVENDKNWIGK